MKPSALLMFVFALAASAQQYTRGIGVYPGDPKEYMGPTLRLDAETYRNLALYRPAYQSSAYNYNLTAQLITDGIKETTLPRWIVTSTSDAGPLPKDRREVFLDGNPTSSIDIVGDNPWVQFDLEGGGEPLQIDRFDLYLRKFYGSRPTGGWTILVNGSNDHANWTEVGRASGDTWPENHDNGPSFLEPIPFAAPAHYRSYRIQFAAPGILRWGVAEVVPFRGNQELHIAGPEQFSSAWMSAGSGEEWVYVDLGADCTFDRVNLTWLQPPSEAALQVSSNTVNWETIQPLPSGSAYDLHLANPAHGRYVRVLMTKPARQDARYILSELEVYGRGGPISIPHPAMGAAPGGELELAGGNWRLQRASRVASSGEQISQPAFANTPDGKNWLIATVPGTILTSYLNLQAIPNPDFGDNQYAVSDSFFCADFWYRNEFAAPLGRRFHQHAWLNFDGINWKAEVYLNGKYLGRIDGGYMRGRFDVTSLLNPGGINALAIRILANANPGSAKDKAGPTVNGGALGRDNPTYHASAGWDWISTIRGRNTGIVESVRLTASGDVTIENPLVATTLPLPEISRADISIQATLRNQEPRPVAGVLRASFGTITMERKVQLDPSSTKLIEFSPASDPALRIQNPKLWWPNGYGDPNLYPVHLTFLADSQNLAKLPHSASNGDGKSSQPSDSISFQAGIRQFTYSDDGGVLKLFINGRRFIARGGNWGFPESMLRYRAREYETAMRYHRDEHFNMIRNWVGQTGDEAFYDAADRNGIVIWQDFWLANPWDGPNPDDNTFFLNVARDYLLRIRNHPSLGLFCGRNEGYPPQQIDDGLRDLVATLEPNSHYISHSAASPVSGGGPYRVQRLRDYFEHAPVKLHSEMGAPNFVEQASLDRTMPPSAQWPPTSQWPLHDFHDHNPFRTAIEQNYGGATTLAAWLALSQFVDYNAYRGMFEGQSKNRLGLLIWMSHPAWPSLLWQTYDYFYDTDAGYYGAKKGAEPLHIQWNAATNQVEVVNLNAGGQTGLTAHAEILDIDGSVKWEKSAGLDLAEDATGAPIKLEFPSGLAPTHFIRLTLTQGGKTVSSNFYLHGLTEEDYRGIRALAPARVSLITHIARHGQQWQLVANLRNTSSTPALMLRVKAVREKSGDPILPALYDDNYIALMPGESRNIHIQLEDADTRGERPRIVLRGYNLAELNPQHKPENLARTQ